MSLTDSHVHLESGDKVWRDGTVLEMKFYQTRLMFTQGLGTICRVFRFSVPNLVQITSRTPVIHFPRQPELRVRKGLYFVFFSNY
jgi:hypothetical protein